MTKDANQHWPDVIETLLNSPASQSQALLKPLFDNHQALPIAHYGIWQQLKANYEKINNIVPLPDAHRPLKSFQTLLGAVHLNCNQTGDLVALGEQQLEATVEVWQVPSGTRVNQFRAAACNVCHSSFSSDNQWLVTSGGQSNKAAQVWDLTSNSLAHTIGRPSIGNQVTPMAFSPDGRYLVAPFVNNKKKAVVQTYKLPLKHTKIPFECFKTNKSIAFCDHGQYLLTLSDALAYNLNLWTFPKLKHVVNLTIFQGPTKAIINQQGTFAACGYRDGHVRVWRLPDGELLTTLTFSDGKVSDLAFSPDGQYLACCSSKVHYVRVWSLPSFKLITDFHHDKVVISLTITPFNLLITSAINPHLWDKPTSPPTISFWQLDWHQPLSSLGPAELEYVQSMLRDDYQPQTTKAALSLQQRNQWQYLETLLKLKLSISRADSQ
ncbi:MAG: WD40 repeat protein [Phenylobacterium sp.]|jgi:WD40 repeat protein